MYRRARASKMEQVSACMKVSGDHYSDQSAVWEDIAERSNELNVNSRTASMLDAYDQYDEYLSAYRKAFKAAAGQVGAVFVVNGVVDGLECFDSPRAFEHTLEKLVGSYAMEAIMKRDKPSGQVAQEEVSAFIDALTGIEADRYPAIGEGEDLRFDQLGLTGGALQVEDRLVHLVAFAPQKRGPVRDRSRSYRNRPVH